MLDLVTLSARNIFRNGRRTAITVFSIIVGFAAMACFGGFIEFSFEGLAGEHHPHPARSSPDLRARVLGETGVGPGNPS